MSRKGKTLFITGASRGIGLAIALRVAAPNPCSRSHCITKATAAHACGEIRTLNS